MSRVYYSYSAQNKLKKHITKSAKDQNRHTKWVTKQQNELQMIHSREIEAAKNVNLSD